MRTRLFYLMAILCIVSASCDKDSLGGNGSGNGGNGGNGEPPTELPSLEEVDNVCTKMDDLGFMSYCYENFDVNKDGKVSMSEASAAKSIECNNAFSFAGLEYFNNLKNFESHSAETVDFRYNTLLETIDCSESKVAEVDLRYNINLLSFSFEDCSLLTSINVPDSVTEIGDGAFADCSSLTSIDIPDSVTEIGSGAFSGCSSLTSIDIPDGVTEIGVYAFSGCSSLTSIDIPDSVTEIGSGAFSGCSSLTSIDIPDGVTEIGVYAFFSCSALEAIDISYGVTEIRKGTFSGCTSLTAIDIPDRVTKIGGIDNMDDYGAFQGCTSLTTIDIPNGVTEIGYGAFADCI